MIVLKIILAILGILLGILLFLVLALLFVPIRYKAFGEVKEETYVKAKVSWFLSTLGIHFLYDRDGNIRVWLRIFFWKKMLYESEEEQEKDLTGESVTDDEPDKPVVADKQKTSDESKETDKSGRTEMDCSGENKTSDETDSIDEILKEEQSSEKKNRKGKPGENIRRMIDRIKAFHYDDRDKAALSHLKEELVKLLKHIFPKKSRLELKYSTGSPDTTGISLGVIAMFPSVYRNHWNVVPDFEAEEAYVKGCGRMKGRIYGYYLLLIVFRLYRDKNCYRLYRKIKRF